MDVDKELSNLEEAQTKLRIKFGSKFKAYYDALTSHVSYNNRLMDELVEANKKHYVSLSKVKVALAHTETEV